MRPTSPRIPVFLTGISFSTLSFLCSGAVGAQELFVEPRLSFGSDFQRGLRSGLGGFTVLGDAAVGGFVDGEIRALLQTVQVRETPTFTYQYRETRYSIGPGFSIAQPLTATFALNSGAGLVFTDGCSPINRKAPATPIAKARTTVRWI